MAIEKSIGEKYNVMEISENQKERIIRETEWFIDRRVNETADPDSIDLIEQFRDMLIGKRALNLDILSKENLLFNNVFEQFVCQMTNYFLCDLEFTNPIIQKLIEKPFNIETSNSLLWGICKLIVRDKSLVFIEQVIRNGCDKKKLIIKLFDFYPLLEKTKEEGYKRTNLGIYLVDKIEDKRTLLGIVKKKGYHQDLVDFVFNSNYYNNDKIFSLGAFLHGINPKLVLQDLKSYIFYILHNQPNFNFELIAYLLNEDKHLYLDKINAIAESQTLSVELNFQLKAIFELYAPGHFQSDLLRLGAEYCSTYFGESKKYTYDKNIFGQGPMMNYYFGLLHDNYPEKFKVEIQAFVNQSYFLPNRFLKSLEEKVGGDIVPILAGVFADKRAYLDEQGVKGIMSILDNYEYNKHFSSILAYTVQHAGKREKRVFSSYLAKYDQNVNRAIELLKGKKIQERIVGALLLSSIPVEKQTDSIFKILNGAIDSESNDETRNVMLESVVENRFSAEYDSSQVKEMISLAENRKKLNKWNYKWLEEEKLPKMYWTNGKECDQSVMRFLLYRMKQCSGMQSDIEAKQVLRHIDKDKAEKFAVYLIQGFADSNSDTKLKYYLTLGGLLGNDRILAKLHSLFRKCITDKRTKMAEYVLGSIAMVGSNKALRLLELISRKYSSKKPRLSQVALASLDASAEELGITKDQLADRIIPMFDFDGTYRDIEIEGEVYRTFINKEFRLIYTDDNNKSRKSIPPAASPELKKEFKSIAKEIKDIVKSQKDRLQRYMIQGRKWSGDEWQEFIFNHPIMFVYATQLLWAKMDKETGKLLEVFYCDEDAEKYNFEDDEIAIERDDEICILHPCYLTEKRLQEWKDKVFEDDIKTIFPIVDRKIYRKLPEELESNQTLRFKNNDIPKGADFAGQRMVSMGYLKTNSDGGRLDFSKEIFTPYVKVFPYIEGPAAWYQNNEAKATVHEITFSGKKWSEKVKIKDVPDAFYSEVMADIDSLIQATV